MKKAFSWLDEHDVLYSFRDFKKDPLSKEELKDLAKLVGIDTLVNRKGMTWRKLGLSGKKLSPSGLIDQLYEHQTMIKRPVVITDDQSVFVGYDEEAFSRLISKESN